MKVRNGNLVIDPGRTESWDAFLDSLADPAFAGEIREANRARVEAALKRVEPGPERAEPGVVAANARGAVA